MKRVILGATMLAAFITPALADQYWVVQDSATKHCSVVSEKPATTTTTVIGNTAFQTREEAQDSIKTTKVCTSE
jgi:hypothetical protein